MVTGRRWVEALVAEVIQRLNQEVDQARREVDARLALARIQHEQELEDIRREFREAKIELGLVRDPNATLH
jgi:hypothetical protein